MSTVSLDRAAQMVTRLYMEMVMANMTDGRRGFWVAAVTPSIPGAKIVAVDGPDENLRAGVLSDCIHMHKGHGEVQEPPVKKFSYSALIHRSDITVAVGGLDDKINKALAQIFLTILKMAY